MTWRTIVSIIMMTSTAASAEEVCRAFRAAEATRAGIKVAMTAAERRMMYDYLLYADVPEEYFFLLPETRGLNQGVGGRLKGYLYVVVRVGQEPGYRDYM
jgi:hypothetical protein